MKKKKRERKNNINAVLMYFGTSGKHVNRVLIGESEVKMSCVLMIILCIVMINCGASDTDAF